MTLLHHLGDGKKLADIGLDDDHCICIWDWKKAEKLATTRGHKDKIYVLEWNPFNNNYFVTVGEKHIKFWTHNGKGLFGHCAEGALCIRDPRFKGIFSSKRDPQSNEGP
jgi:WD40 repeat protein